MTYDKGDVAVLSGAFDDASGTATDPTTIVLKYINPAGTVTTLTYPTGIVKDATGRYHYDLTLNASGTWAYRWEGTGAVVAAGEKKLVVRSTAFP